MTQEPSTPSIEKKECMMETFYEDERRSRKLRCSVRMDDLQIVVEYRDGGVVAYKGKAEEAGYYHLTGSSRDDRATLHRVPGNAILEGSWNDGASKGMWRIYLGDS